MKKYKFTKEKMKYNGYTLKRIKRLSDGLVGGWIEKEDNLSHEGDCFIFENAKVYGNAEVFDDAKVCGSAEIFGNAQIFGNVEVLEKAKVYGGVFVWGEAKICGNVEIMENAQVFGRSILCGNATINGLAKIFDNAKVFGNAKIFDNAKIYENAKVYGNAIVYSYSELNEDMKVSKIVNNISGLRYNITASDDHIKIGCQTKTKKEWLKVTKKQAIKMGLLEADYKQYMLLIKALQ